MRILTATLGILCALSFSACGRAQTPTTLPPLPDNPPVAPLGELSVAEMYVTNSVPVMPGTKIEIVDQAGPALLVSNALVINVRWKVPGPFMAPSYPAAGFVAVSLAKNQWEAVQKAQDILVRPRQ